MSVILTDIDMPNSCSECRLKTRCEYALANGWINNKRDDNCPLKPYEERKKGRWKAYVDYGNHRHWLCSCCGKKGYKTRFCSECGAEMEGAEE